MGLEQKWGPEKYKIFSYFGSYIIILPGEDGIKGAGGGADKNLNFHIDSGLKMEKFKTVKEALEFLYTIPLDND
jgi:hypothetical protein